MPSDSFGFEKKSITVEGKALFLFSRQAKFGMNEGIKMCEEPKHEIDACCRVQHCFGRWYILIPYKVENEQKEVEEGRVGALDPGVRTFQATYSEKECGEIAPGMEKVARAMKKKIDGIRGRIAALKVEATQEEKGGSRHKAKSLRQKVKKVTKAWCRARASTLVSDLHFKTIAFLFRRFDVIVAPQLGVGRMLVRGGVLTAGTKETMRFQRPYLFSQRLRIKAEACGKVVLDFEEHGTSKTCSSCGQANRGLGGNKVFKCGRCGHEENRDVNSAKNHLLKALVGVRDY